ncbi:Gfo/Idh/MocA family protein [Pontibacter oryzae]|uniref:Gfo/Idh/MocA family oxidoreductase n=1 Tax=Pontibacter oryzae TaxID=2304593 RepID=A0A399SFJ2_9BACT|nr:Gfo/Idh/MocA family oxidoreductase [Pontibacter oryzae]RIJ41978.1 gfo/Idh/MocA family oxidoreductase [Pontibacter oryzae]
MADLGLVRFVVIGVGHIGKRHAVLIMANPACQLVALIDNREGFSLSSEFTDVPKFASLDEFILSEIPAEVLCVCTPNYLHYTHTLRGLALGLHVVCEKPMALAATHSQHMIATAKAAGKHIFCVMQNRYSPPAVWLRSVLEQELLGEVYHVQVNCFWNRDARYYTPLSWRGNAQQDGGTLFTQFSHFIDMLYWLFGDFRDIRGQFRNFNHQGLTDFEDSGFLQFELERGGLCTFNYSTSVPGQNLESSMTIISERGSIKIDGQYMNQVSQCQIQDYQMPDLPASEPANNYGPYSGSAANHKYVIENVVHTLKHGGAVSTNASDGFKVVELIERIYALKETVQQQSHLQLPASNTIDHLP